MTQPPTTSALSDQGPVPAVVYVLGDSPELGVVASALRAGGHPVVELDVATADLSALLTRPIVLAADPSPASALELLRRVDELPDSAEIDVVLLMAEDVPPELDNATAGRSVSMFRRPIDVTSVIGRVRELIGASDEAPPPSLPPDPDMGPARGHPSSDDLAPPLSSSSPLGRLPTPSPLLSYAPAAWQGSEVGASSSNPPERSWPSSTPPAYDASAAPRRTFAGPTSVSPDLEGLLSSAQQRVFSEAFSSSDVPTPEEEVNAILPPDVLAALDEPLDADAADEASEDESAARTPAGVGTTGARGHTGTGSSVAYEAPVEPVTATGEDDDVSPPPTTGAHPYVADSRRESSSGGGTADLRSSAEAQYELEDQPAPARGLNPAPRRESAPIPQPPVEVVVHAMPVASPGSMPPPQSDPQANEDAWGAVPAQPLSPPAPAPRQSGRPSLPPVLTASFDGLSWMASCVAARISGAVCFEDAGVQRRAVLRDGDFVTCASSSAEESLVAYLLERGELPRDVMAYMVARVPPFGRHAAAALIANGFLGQDQLWTVLRGHCEWVLGRMVRARSGVGAIEMDPPGRLKAEPSVFGGATGAEVLVEVARRVYSPEEALGRLGGREARLAPGRNASLVAECALDGRDHAVVGQISGMTVDQAIEQAGQDDFATILCVLAALGAVEVLRVARAPDVAVLSQAAEADRLDVEAVRQRVRARMAVIEEGDYFQVLGVPPTATPYEIRRAFVEARRAFEPSRLLTAATVDLADDVQLVVEVLEEAYEVLRDGVRRERYLRALQARPPSPS